MRLRKLFRRRTFRESERVFVLEGVRAIGSALEAAADVESIFFERSALDSVEDILSAARQRGISLYEVQNGTLEKVADSVSSQGIVAVARVCDVSFSSFDTGDFVVVLAGIRDPGNAGTIIRAALASGAGGVIFCNQSVDVYNPKCLRSSAGAIFSISVSLVDSFEEVARGLKGRGYRLIGTSSHASRDSWSMDLTGKIAFVFGGEANGLSEAEAASLDDIVTIPIDARAESLNVAMAASVLMFEARRQIRVVSAIPSTSTSARTFGAFSR